MELLNQLEQRVITLLSRLDALAGENAALKEEQTATIAALTEENRTLREQLETEHTRNTAALTRVEALIDRIKEQTGTE